MKTLDNLRLLLLTAAIVSLSLPILAASPVAVAGASPNKCLPGYTLTMTPASVTANPGTNASFVATVQGICDMEGMTIQFTRQLSPTVTNGPLLFPPPICYHGCNIVPLTEDTPFLIKTTVITSTSTPAGTYTFTLNVFPDSCPSNFPPGTGCTLNLPPSVSATITVA